MHKLKVVSLNVNGLNSPPKRQIIFDYLRKTGADFYLLQETHATDATSRIWAQEWGGTIIANNGSQSSKGVMVMARRHLALQPIVCHQDNDGRILAMDVKVDEIIYTIINVYAPTQDKPRDQLLNLEKIEEFLADLDSANIIMGGDFNCHMIPQEHSFLCHARLRWHSKQITIYYG